MAGACGDCTICCLVFRIPEVPKERDVWCTHCEVGKGCTIYQNRPKPCVDFECLWLQSQERGAAKQALHLRPDKSKLMLMASPDGEYLSGMCHPKYPKAWQEPVNLDFLDRISRVGIPVVVRGAADEAFFFEHGTVVQVELGPEDEKGHQTIKRRIPGTTRLIMKVK